MNNDDDEKFDDLFIVSASSMDHTKIIAALSGYNDLLHSDKDAYMERARKEIEEMCG